MKIQSDRFDEITPTGTVNVGSCLPLDSKHQGLELTVAEGYDDVNGYSAVILQCEGGWAGIRYHLSADKAEALAALLREAAKEVRNNNELPK